MERLELMGEVTLDLMRGYNKFNVEIRTLYERQKEEIEFLRRANAELTKQIGELEEELEKYRYTE